jgi:uncharacterized protein
MDNKCPDAKHSKEVVRVSGMKINPGQEKDYDDWLRHYMILERNAPGYIGTTIICPGGTMSSLRYKVSRWADASSLDAWENSQQCLELIEEANKFSTRYHERATGLEAWFTLPDFKAVVAPPKWKMAIAIFIAANTISSLSRYILNPFLAQWPLWASTALYTSILVVLLTYLAMPAVTRLLQRWLYPRTTNL